MTGRDRGAAAPVPAPYRALVDLLPRLRHVGVDPGHRLLREALGRRLRSGMRVLDVGCGPAVVACHLAASGAVDVRYEGIDPSPSACEAARRVLASLPREAVTGEIHATPLVDYLRAGAASFDLIVAAFAFHEIVGDPSTGDARDLTRELGHRLSAGGHVIIGDPFVAPGASPEEVAAILRYNAEAVAHEGDAGRPFVAPEVAADLLGAAGLVVAERVDGPLFYLAHYLGMPHARVYVLTMARPSP